MKAWLQSIPFKVRIFKTTVHTFKTAALAWIERELVTHASPLFEHSRLTTPTILQMEATECGAVALGIVLAYYQKFVSLEELREACGISRDGSKATNILKAARQYGLEANGAQGEPEALQQLTFPFIVFWKFNHFIVVEEITPTAVFINDPATGRRRITTAEFNRSFTGIIIGLKPGPNFKPSGHPPQLLDTLKERIKGSTDAIAFLTLASVALILPGIMIPGFSKIFVDDILVRGLKNWLPMLLTGMFLTAIFRSLLSGLQQYFFLRLHLKLMITQAARFIWHVLKLPLSFFEQRYAGDITNRIKSTDALASLISRDLSISMVSVISMVFFAIIMFLYDWLLALVGICTAILNTLILLFMIRQLSDMSRRLAQERGRLEGIEINGLHVIETLKSSNLDNQFFKRWAGNHAKTIQTQQRLALYHQVLSTLPALLSGLSTVIILGLGSYRVMDGLFTVGTLVAFQSLLASFNAPIVTLLGIGTELQELRADIARLDDIFQHQEDPRYKLYPSTEKEIAKHAEKGIVELKNITFGYSRSDPPLIENFNLTLKPGGKVALLGATGSGKSTIAKLICGLYQPWSGEVLFNKIPLPTLSPEVIANKLSFVDQDILLFEGSIRDNLTLWDTSVPKENIDRATEDAAVREVISHRDHLLDSHVQEFAQNFSSGERQRLEIARALVKNPEILVLDEGTSALDSITEEKIVQNLRKRGCSLLLITHRLHAIQDSDDIIVLDKGKIIEQGTHQQLIARNGCYSELVRQAV